MLKVTPLTSCSCRILCDESVSRHASRAVGRTACPSNGRAKPASRLDQLAQVIVESRAKQIWVVRGRISGVRFGHRFVTFAKTTRVARIEKDQFGKTGDLRELATL
jgi:hypothetical protein